MSTKCQVMDLGLVEYQEAYQVQKSILEKRKQNEVPDTLLILQHPPVITVGRGGNGENILASKEELRANSIAVHKIDRGGDVTFHGPGQLVAYPIFNLKEQIKDVHLYLRKLEEVVIQFLKKYKVSGLRQQGAAGVWVKPSRNRNTAGSEKNISNEKNNQKIASIGIGLSSWVTYHGVAIKVNADLSKFSLIRPCGMDSHKITSLNLLLFKTVNIIEAKGRLLEAFEAVFNMEIEVVQPFSLVA